MSFSLQQADTQDDPRYTKQGALHVPVGEGLTVWALGDTYTVKATAGATDGRLTFIEASVPPGAGTAPLPHVHNDHDEAFFLLSGELEFLDGDRTFVAHQGDFVFVPRGIRHRFLNVGTHAARMVFLFNPAMPDKLFTEMAERARPGEQAPPFKMEGDGSLFMEESKNWGSEILP